MHTHTPSWAVGMRKLGPGIYADGDGALHISEAEGVPDSLNNAALIRRVIEEFAQSGVEFPRYLEIIVVEPPEGN